MSAIPIPCQPVTIVSETIDNSAQIAKLEKAKRRLRWRKAEGDEDLAGRIDREIARLRAEEGPP